MTFNDKFSRSNADALLFEGMMGELSVALFQAFLSFQKNNSISGNLAEYGVFRGKSAAVLLNNLEHGERAYLIDIADYPEFEKLDLITDQYTFIKGKSEDLVQEVEFQKTMDRKFKFSHHDASHSFRNVTDEMNFMKDKLTPNGIMVLDDFQNPNFLQVSAACFALCAKPDFPLEVFLVSSNKAYLCRKEDFATFNDFIVSELLTMINSVTTPCSVGRTELSENYRGFALYPKLKPDNPNFYGVNTYGEQYYRKMR